MVLIGKKEITMAENGLFSYPGLRPLAGKKGKTFGNDKYSLLQTPSYKSNFSADPYIVPETFSLENTNMQDALPKSITDSMKYQSVGYSSDMSGSLVNAFTDSGVTLPNSRFGVEMPSNDEYGKYSLGNTGGLKPAPASTSTPNSYLPSGWFDGKKNGETYKADNGKWMTSGMFSDSASKATDFGTLAEAQQNGFYKDSKMTDAEYNTAKFDQGRLDSQNFNNYAGLGLGAAQFATSLYSTFGSGGSMDMNKKNIELMDGQIANNNDIMATRKARAADIAKYFG